MCQKVCEDRWEEGCMRVYTVQRRWKDGLPEGIEKVGRTSAKGYMERGTGEQGFGSGSGLDPDSIGPVDPDPGGQK